MSQDYVEDESQSYAGDAYQVEPIPVVNVTQRQTPEKASCMTWAIPQTGQGTPVQVLQRRERRFKAKAIITFPGAGTVTINSRQDGVANNQGYTITVPNAGIFSLPDWETEQPLWAIASISGCTFAVIDESFMG